MSQLALRGGAGAPHHGPDGRSTTRKMNNLLEVLHSGNWWRHCTVRESSWLRTKTIPRAWWHDPARVRSGPTTANMGSARPMAPSQWKPLRAGR